LLVSQLTYLIDESMQRNSGTGLWTLQNIQRNPVTPYTRQNLFYNLYYMKNNQFQKLSDSQIETIEILTSKWTSQRQIQRITRHGRQTIRKYQYAYLNRKIIEWLDRQFANTSIYTISFWFVWLALWTLIVLSSLGLYFLINL
jgi:hypothetical protein